MRITNEGIMGNGAMIAACVGLSLILVLIGMVIDGYAHCPTGDYHCEPAFIDASVKPINSVMVRQTECIDRCTAVIAPGAASARALMKQLGEDDKKVDKAWGDLFDEFDRCCATCDVHRSAEKGP